MGYKDGLVSCIMVLCLVCLAYRVYADSYLIDCGATSNTTIGNRVFLADRYAAKYLSTRPNILVKTLSENNLLYHTARVFRNLTSYTFPISQTGRYFIRFHFFPFTSKSYDLSSAKFMVFAQQFKLLNEFSPPKVSVVKEYSVLVNTNRLTILIVPTVNSIAFLNAIEVFLVPDSVTTDYATLINPLPGYKDLVTMALETVYRVNMGGSNIDFDGDKFWRSWIQDDRFLEQKDLSIDIHKNGAANYTSGLVAPLVVYESCRELNSQNDIIANVSWNFSVNRDSLMISEDLDLTSLAKGSLDTPVYLDYITPELTTNTLRVSIGPTAGAQNQPNAILNGLEIFKVSNEEKNLDDESDITLSKLSPKSKHKVGVIVGVVIGFLSLLLAILLLRFCERGSIGEGHSTASIPVSFAEGTSHSVVAPRSDHHIPIVVIEEATNNFDQQLVIGGGGFGKVYKGELSDGRKIAVKRRITDNHGQGLDEFRTEIEFLLQFRHRNLVTLIGYCDDNNELIIRLNICVGVATGIQYLHTGVCDGIIHRDVKSGNILLDRNFDAKVSDFGLSKASPRDHPSHNVTAVKGTPGYMDPAYFKTGILTKKSDIYSFGVVMFEILLGKRAIENGQNLVERATNAANNDYLEHIIDCHLQGSVDPWCLQTYWEIAARCVGESTDRPSMALVLSELERVQCHQANVLQSQQIATEDASGSGIGSEIAPQITYLSEEASL
ncbi:hypothetical protein SOVF_208280 [Spinacia oleracea]|nr:hypothetical protein SOVF_208280 [Spinacia oleracea]